MSYPPKKLNKYPHMLPADVRVWEKFIDRYADDFLSFDYDVHVGGEVEKQNEWTEEVFVMWQTLAQKRIDVVGYKSGEDWIFEVKPEGGLSALGQLVGYRDLYVRDKKPVNKIVVALVCENITKDERWLLEKQGFLVFEMK